MFLLEKNSFSKKNKMGQKINPNIFRLGVTKNWKTEFFEKKKKELPLYLFKDLEIQSYIERFIESKTFIISNKQNSFENIPIGVFIHDYYQYYNDNTLNLCISYLVVPKSNVYGLKKKKDLLKSEFLNNKKFSSNLIQKNKFFKNMHQIKKYLVSTKFDKNFSPFNLFNNNLENMLRIISIFTFNKFDIRINFSCLNKDFKYLKFLKVKRIRMLQKFRLTPFFKNGLELLFHVTFNKNSARILSKFIASQLKEIERPNFFFSFIKRTLSILISSKLSTVKGIKIKMNGRLNKRPRAKQRIINIGDVKVQTLFCNIDYFQTTTHNVNGSYGIKVWIVEKIK